MEHAITQPLEREEIVNLCTEFCVAELSLFRSAAKGKFMPGKSDYVFLVRFFPATPTEHADRYFGLLARLQDRLGAEVDLLESEAVCNSHLRKELDASSVLLYAA